MKWVLVLLKLSVHTQYNENLFYNHDNVIESIEKIRPHTSQFLILAKLSLILNGIISYFILVISNNLKSSYDDTKNVENSITTKCDFIKTIYKVTICTLNWFKRWKQEANFNPFTSISKCIQFNAYLVWVY